MNENFLDPDLKIHMSLDEIIHLTKPAVDSQLNQKFFGGVKKRRKRRRNKMSINDHSVPLMSSLGGGYIMVTKKSPLLSAASKRDIVNAVSNRQINSELIEKNREVIPARYKLVKTDCGIERVLVPAGGIDQSAKKVLGKVLQNSRQIDSPLTLSLLHRPRPLHPPHLNSPKNFSQVDDSLKMEVHEEEEEEEEIKILKVEKVKIQNPIPVIDIDCDDLEKNPNVFKTMTSATLNTGAKTLHDRFTQLGTGVRF